MPNGQLGGARNMPSGGFGGGLSRGPAPGGANQGGAAMGPFGHGNAASRTPQFAGAGGSASGIGVRPGAGAGPVGAGGEGSGIGVRPGAGAGAPGLGGPASGIGVRPGMGAGYAGVPAAAGGALGYGTRYANSAALAEQGAAFRAGAVGYRAYTPAMLGAYAGAWTPTNLVGASLYTHPGYAALATGLGLGAQPIPYDYGGNVVVQSQAVYVNGDSVADPQEYANQASQLAATAQSAPATDETKWLPLGVFALVEGDQTTSDDNFQLAVNQQGIIRGNYHNLKSDDLESLAGAVDKSTQRVAWTIGSDKKPVYECGIANLTKDETPLLVHLGDGSTRQVTLIRLPQPADADSSR